jgi:hypothetical protein
VGKLSRLSFLWVENDNHFGKELEHSVQLEKLRTLRRNGLTDESVPHLLRMKLDHLDSNNAKFSDDSIERLNAGISYVEIDESRISRR